MVALKLNDEPSGRLRDETAMAEIVDAVCDVCEKYDASPPEMFGWLELVKLRLRDISEDAFIGNADDE